MSITTAQLPTTEPQTIAAGDTAEWIRYLNDFPATSFTLKYVLQGPRIITFNAQNDGGNYLISLTSAVTRAWVPGLYRISAYVVNADASIQRQVRTAFLRISITPNVAVNPNGATPLTFAEKGLESIELTILQLTTRTVEQASVNGQVYTLANIQDLFLLRERFKSEVRREEEQARLNAGLGAGNKIGVRFRPLTWVGYPTYPQVPWQ